MITLNVYLYNKLAGYLSKDKKGQIFFIYDKEYISNKDNPPISNKIPIDKTVYKEDIILPFLSHLLPDGEQLSKISKNLGIEESNILKLLDILGGEMIGAISFNSKKLNTGSLLIEEGHLLGNDELYDILFIVNDFPLLTNEHNFRASLPGINLKIPVAIFDNCITLIKGIYPTTHIIKLSNTFDVDKLYNELFCIKLVELAGINTVKCDLKWCNNIPYLLISRFDRYISESKEVHKLHQENFTQLLGMNSSNKFEYNGGASIKDCLDIIDTYSSKPALDKLQLIRLLILNYIIGNNNISANDFSFVYNKNSTRLSPAYNLFSDIVYSISIQKMGLKIGDQYYSNLLKLNNWHAILSNNATANSFINDELKKYATLMPELALKLQYQFHQNNINSEIFDNIISIITKRSKYILRYFV